MSRSKVYVHIHENVVSLFVVCINRLVNCKVDHLDSSLRDHSLVTCVILRNVYSCIRVVCIAEQEESECV